MFYFRDGAQAYVFILFNGFPAPFADVGKGSSVGAGCHCQETDISFEGLVQTLEVMACRHGLAFLCPLWPSPCLFDGGEKENESDGLLLLSELVIAHLGDAFSWDLSTILLSNSAGFSST